MTQQEQQQAAKKFSAEWKDKGYEKGESQKFWLDLLCNVFGVKDFANFVYFENQIKEKMLKETPNQVRGDGHSEQQKGHSELDSESLTSQSITNFIDIYIPSTKVMIEQKSINKDLREPIRQSDGTLLNPFQQARKYIAGLPLSQHPRWVVTCNFKSFLVYDMEQPNGEPEEILLENLEKEYYRLSFITDTGSVHLKKELEISKKAGDIIGEIYDAILKQYKDAEHPSPATLKSLNMLCVRIVFCLYAEDAGIFGHKSIFGDYLKQFEAKDLRRALLDLFAVLDQKPEERDEYLEESLAQFPYVNGGLFTEEDRTIPPLTEEIKDLLVRHASSEFDWSEISPTIFGAIFESTLNPETRRSGGMHYTSIENIHKVIDPLFLDDLKSEFEKLKQIKNTATRIEKVKAFHKKLGTLKFLDPACGSGNFLTETYLSLRKLGNECIKVELNIGEGELDLAYRAEDLIQVSIQQFYGIEINDFAAVVAKTALWIAESQMMKETSKIIEKDLKFLPLHTYANIVEGNALRIDWEKVGDRSEEIGSRNEEVGDRNGEKLRGFDCLAEGDGFDSGNLSADEDVAERRIIFSSRSNEAGCGVNSFEHSGRIRAEKSEGISPLSSDCAGFSNGTGNAIKNLPADTISVGGTNKESSRCINGNSEDDFSATNSSLLTSNSYDYILGNPPFVGYAYQTKEQKDDLESVMKGFGKNIDYVAGWYYKAAQLMQGTKTKAALVSTNSITQGEQVAAIWKPMFEKFGMKFDFAWRTFRWDSEANIKAHVHCVIIGFSCKEVGDRNEEIGVRTEEIGDRMNTNSYILTSNSYKKIYLNESQFIEAKNINGYLLDAPDIFIENSKKPLCDVPEMQKGSIPVDGGNLIIEAEDYEDFIKKEPQAKQFIKPLVGSEEFINNKKRWCLWLVGANPSDLKKCPLVMERVQKVKEMRLASSKEATRKFADYPTRFMELRQPETDYLLVPRVSSEQRRYIPIGYMSKDVISTDANMVLPNATLYHFGILISNVHMAWMRAVAGRLKSDYRYSNTIVYNNFPWPNAMHNSECIMQSEEAAGKDKQLPIPNYELRIEQTAQAILDARAKYPDSSLADLYDETLMPPELRKAHQANDRAVMQAYGFSTKMTESECVAELFKLYEKLVQKV